MKERSRGRRLAAAALAVVLAGFTIVVTDTTAAFAATAKDFGPVVVTDIPPTPTDGSRPTHKVVALATISTPMTAGATAYLYSFLRAYDADQVNLVDNEVRCGGAGVSDVVMGENVLPPSAPNPAHRDITVVTRFLVSATATGTLTCTLYLRTASTSYEPGRETVAGTVRFAATAVGEDVDGLAMQTSLPAGSYPVPGTRVAPVLDRTLPAGYEKVAVIADVEYHRCASGPTCTTGRSTARFTLTATTSGGPGCASAPVAQTQETVPTGVNHAAVPLYTTVLLRPGCDQLHAKVTTTHVSDDVGSLGGPARLTDSGGPPGSGPSHDSAMTHLFAVPS